MRKIRPLFLITAIILIVSFCATALADTALVVTPDKGKLNLRQNPSTTNSKRLTQIPYHTVIEILEVDGDWAKAVYNGKTGFVSLSDVDLTGFVSEIIGSGTITLNGNASGRAEIKIRYAGSSSGKVVDNWKTGTKVTVLDEKNGFCQIEAKGLRVWVQDKYLTLDE